MTTHTTILIVDDSSENLKLLGNSLKNAGFNILAALTGKQALALAAGKQPDLILLDVMMPEMNGFEVCEALKQNDSTCRIPIIFLTASVEIESIKNGFDAGGADYIAKPFNPDELILRIKNHLKQKTERENLERELRFRSYVLKNISNGITTPLSQLLQNSDLLSQNSFPEAFKISLEQINASVNAIMKFTSNLTDLVYTEEPNNSKENQEVFRLKELLEILQTKVDITLKNTANNFVIDAHAVPDLYTGNKNKLLQALVRLVSALLNQSEKGFITVTASVKERRDKYDVILLEINNLYKEKGFVAETYDSSSLHEISLLTARELLLFVNGKITSTPGASLSPNFAIEISLERFVHKTQREEKPSCASFSGKNILVVEDSELNQRLIESVLQSYGAHTTIATNGEEALEKILSQPYDVILMDVNVPLLNGIEVTKVIRNRHAIQTPIIAISGYSDKSSLEKCKDAGMNSFLLKPFEISDLHKIVLGEFEKNKNPNAVAKVKNFANIAIQVKEVNQYNLDRLNILSNGDQKLIKNWMNHFKDLVKKGILEVDSIIKANDYSTESKIFHELNNYTSYFGVELLREYLKDLPKIHKSASTEDLMDHFRLIAEELINIDCYFESER
ncbi:hypothetical protein CNR22_18940 [Sphingobacteriaceae bacterium]|nr:hypothetical protein CNR22_18940 [Sphingobacteriaceae bacterium]